MDHWIVLIQRIAVLLLNSVAYSPQCVLILLSRALPSDPIPFRGPASLYHLQILDKLLSPTSSAQALGPLAGDLRVDISSYLLRHGLYPLLAEAFKNIVRPSHLPLDYFLMRL